jgi:hypothetical protein
VLASIDIFTRVRLERKALIAGCSFLGVLAVSLLLFFFVGNGKTPRILFFPHPVSKVLVAERRFLTNHHDLEADIRELVEEEILGPSGHETGLLIPREVTVRSILVRKGTLYLDLSEEMAVTRQNVVLEGQDLVSAVERAVAFNFPSVRDLNLTIAGQTPRFGR